MEKGLRLGGTVDLGDQLVCTRALMEKGCKRESVIVLKRYVS